MTSFRNKLSAALFLSLFIYPALAEDKIPPVPSVRLYSLKKMDTNGYGTIVPSDQDVLNQGIWKNSSYPVIAAKMAQIPQTLPAAAEELRLKILKLATDPPAGTTGQDFITLRLKRLFERGQFDDVLSLLKKIPEKQRTDEQNKIHLDVLLIRDFKNSCALSEKESDMPEQLYHAAVCAAEAQDSDKAFLALDLLKEQGKSDEFTSNAVDYFLYAKPLNTPPENVTPLSASVWRETEHSLTDLQTSQSPLWFNALLAEDKSVAGEIRLPLAEQLTQKGLMPASKLKDLYEHIPLPDKKNKTLSGAFQRAALIRRAMTETDNLSLQEMMKEGFQSAKKEGVPYAFTLTVKDILEKLTPDADTLAESLELIEMFSLAELPDKVSEWQSKAELAFPVSETSAYGWYFANLFQQDENQRFFTPALKNMTAYEEQKQIKNRNTSAKQDRLMLVFKILDLLSPEEEPAFATFSPDAAENAFIGEKESVSSSLKEKTGERLIEVLKKIDGSYIGLLNALSGLNELGLSEEAKKLAAQSMDLILGSEKQDE